MESGRRPEVSHTLFGYQQKPFYHHRWCTNSPQRDSTDAVWAP